MKNPSNEELLTMAPAERTRLANKMVAKIVATRIVVPIVVASAVVIGVHMLEKHLDKKDFLNAPE